MSWFGDRDVVLSISVCLFLLLLVLIKVFYKLWWIPIRVQNRMTSQGIKGPSYRFIHGNNKQVASMRKEAMSRPKSLSHDVFSIVLPHMHSWTKIYGKNFLYWYGHQPLLVVTETELCKEILMNKNGAYQKSKPLGSGKKLLGDGLVTTTDGQKWSKLRKLANHAFHGESLKSMHSEMIASTETMLERWKIHEGEEVEVFEEFRLLTSEVISRTAFASSYVEGKNIFDMLLKFSALTFSSSFKPEFPGISKFVKSSCEIEFQKLEKGIRESLMEIVKRRERNPINREANNFGSDFLGQLLKAHHDTNDNLRISMEDLVDECKTFYLAGHESTGTMLAWTVSLLALHPEWQEKARKEVQQFFGKQNPDPNGISNLNCKEMAMIVNESLRLYPPVLSLVNRKVEKETRLGRLVLPANLHLVIPISPLHYDPQLWGQDVQLFKPERFSEGVAKATNDNIAAFLPFGMGPRVCAGSNFATSEAKIALSMILQHYTFTLSPTYTHSPSVFLTVRPQHGVPIMLHAL